MSFMGPATRKRESGEPGHLPVVSLVAWVHPLFIPRPKP